VLPGPATSRPSMADMTEIAGVIAPSPKSIAAPPMTTDRCESKTNRSSLRRRWHRSREQSENPALTVVVDSHDERHILETNDHNERPYEE